MTSWIYSPSFGGWKLVEDCTSEELQEAASYLESLRDNPSRRIAALYELADRLDEAGVETERDLP